MTTTTVVRRRRGIGCVPSLIIIVLIIALVSIFFSWHVPFGFRNGDNYTLLVIGNQDVRVGADNADIEDTSYSNILGLRIIYATFECGAFDCGVWVTHPGMTVFGTYQYGSRDERR